MGRSYMHRDSDGDVQMYEGARGLEFIFILIPISHFHLAFNVTCFSRRNLSVSRPMLVPAT